MHNLANKDNADEDDNEGGNRDRGGAAVTFVPAMIAAGLMRLPLIKGFTIQPSCLSLMMQVPLPSHHNSTEAK
jgi:hypothetical protein